MLNVLNYGQLGSLLCFQFRNGKIVLQTHFKQENKQPEEELLDFSLFSQTFLHNDQQKEND